MTILIICIAFYLAFIIAIALLKEPVSFDEEFYDYDYKKPCEHDFTYFEHKQGICSKCGMLDEAEAQNE